jgi:DNA invertase Pin-like site-specific DNA recombinase
LELGARWPKGLAEHATYEPTSYRTARPISTAEVNELVRAWEAGLGVVKIAAQFGIHRQTVGRHLQARGIDTTEKLSPEAIVEAAELYEMGWSLARLGDKFGISDGTIRRKLLEVGMTMRKRKGGREKTA